MSRDLIDTGFDTLLARGAPGGGFIGRNQGSFRPDATAWAILALEARGYEGPALQSSRDRLVTEQRPDGRVCLSSLHEEVFWPTSLAVLAWQSSPRHSEPKARAVRFLLKTSGLHETNQNPLVAHDTSLKGWPWIGDTCSWIEPTALTVIALRVAGFSGHERVKEAENLIMNRQLLNGGWNHGNTFVFGKELSPIPESTGIALNGLAGSVPQEHVEKSLHYLKSRLATLKTPRSLAWSLMGLSVWRERPENYSGLIRDCLARQKYYGEYDTVSLAILLLAFKVCTGLAWIFRDSPADGRPFQTRQARS